MTGSPVYLMVDQYKLWEEERRRGYKSDPKRTAEDLCQMVKLLGTPVKKLALVEESDRKGLEAFHKANFQVQSMNGERTEMIYDYAQMLEDGLAADRPGYLVAVTNDMAFHPMFRTVSRYNVRPIVLVPGRSIPSIFHNAEYDVRLLNDVLPEPKATRYDVRIDYENIHIGLQRNGYTISPKDLIEVIKRKAASLGDTGKIVAYADWDLLSRTSRVNIQRELSLMSGVDTRYQVNEKGKNSADMQIAMDIHNLLDKPSNASDFADVIILCTGDRDFKAVVDEAKSRGKKVVLIAVKGTLSKELEESADEVYYLDDLLPRLDSSPAVAPPTPTDEHAEFAIHFAALLARKHWPHVYTNRLGKIPVLKNREQLEKAVADKIITRDKGQLYPNRQHLLLQVATHLVDWAPWRIKETKKRTGRDSITVSQLAREMRQDRKLTSWQVGQQPQEAEKWLELLVAAKVIVKETRPHHRNPNHTVEVLTLPQHSKPAVSTLPTLTPDPMPAVPPAPRIAEIRKLITSHHRRLQKLKEKAAGLGINTPAEILVEIEDIEPEIDRLQQELVILQQPLFAATDNEILTGVIINDKAPSPACATN